MQLVLDAKVVLLLMTTLASTVVWLFQMVGTQARIYYMKKKGYAFPDKKELKKYAKYAACKMLGLPVDEID